jgi:hypothetical protein
MNTYQLKVCKKEVNIMQGVTVERVEQYGDVSWIIF